MKAIEYDSPVIVVKTESGKPMCWDKDQFVLSDALNVNASGKYRSPVDVYEREEAKQFIKDSIQFRKNNNFSVSENEYSLVNVRKI